MLNKNSYMNRKGILTEGFFDKFFKKLKNRKKANILKKDSSVNCFQKCIDCLLCYTKNDTETIIEVKK